MLYFCIRNFRIINISAPSSILVTKTTFPSIHILLLLVVRTVTTSTVVNTNKLLHQLPQHITHQLLPQCHPQQPILTV